MNLYLFSLANYKTLVGQRKNIQNVLQSPPQSRCNGSFVLTIAFQKSKFGVAVNSAPERHKETRWICLECIFRKDVQPLCKQTLAESVFLWSLGRKYSALFISSLL